MAWFAPKPCGRIGRERRLSRAKAVRTNRTGTKALSGQSRADESDGSKSFVGSKPCGRIGRERKLCRAKAVRSMAMARFAPKPCDERTGAKALSCQSRADERTGQEAEAKMGVILAQRR